MKVLLKIHVSGGSHKLFNWAELVDFSNIIWWWKGTLLLVTHMAKDFYVKCETEK